MVRPQIASHRLQARKWVVVLSSVTAIPQRIVQSTTPSCAGTATTAHPTVFRVFAGTLSISREYWSDSKARRAS